MLTRVRKQKQGLLAFGLIISAFLFTACEKSPVQSIQAIGETLFGNRPTQQQNFKAIVKLQSPALFSTATLKDGHAVVDQDLLASINEEQAAFTAKLAEVAPNTKILFKYRMVLNGFAVYGPMSELEKLNALGLVTNIETDGGFDRPKIMAEEKVQAIGKDLRNHNSVKFIGAENLRNRTIKNSKGELVPLDGTGMKVGVIDTGIDYTHAMLGGVGSANVFKSIDPAKPTSYFPNKHVVGGIDLAGTDYNAASPDFAKHIPKPDANPIDEGGHGSHVAGTVAGIAANEDMYSGVAPGASLYAIKVFGANGSTSDSVVIAGLEYAANPAADGNPVDQLDVVNLSLGGPFGSGKVLYTEAIQNLTQGGTVVVASAGNEGDIDSIVGSPSVSEAAISVAASVDDMLHNWQFAAILFNTPTAGDLKAEALEAATTKSIEDAGDVTGPLVYVGLADKDFSDELKAQVKGKIAFADRGLVAFSDKIRRSQEAGAIGVIVANNDGTPAFVMGGDGKFDIPAVMITQALGATLKEEMKKGEVVVHFKTSDVIVKPNLIDTITSFSSKGPRSVDALIKPEISSPGQDIISADMGQGDKVVKMSGTSMAGPHVAGAMALLKQAHLDLSVAELKALLLNRAKTIKDEKGEVYSVSRQGSGRIQIDESVDAKILMQPAAVSLGEVAIETRKSMRKSVSLRNLTKEALSLKVKLVLRGTGLSMKESSVSLAAGEEKDVALNLVLDATAMTDAIREMDGWIVVEQDGAEISRVPVLAIARKIANIQATNLVVESGANDGVGASASVTLSNAGRNSGDVMLFNLIALDKRKQEPNSGVSTSRNCDLQSVGYRLVQKEVNGAKIKVLQVAAKVYQPTQWKTCEIDVLIDSDDDQVAQQELAAITNANVPGLDKTPATQYKMLSALFDAPTLRKLRAEAEAASKLPPDKDHPVEENYTDAVIDAIPLEPLDRTTIMVIEADVSKLALRSTGELAIKVVAQDWTGSSSKQDDFLTGSPSRWINISVAEQDQSFVGLPEKVSLAAGETKTVEFEKGAGNAELMVLMPQNLTVFSDVLEDRQQQLMKPNFVAP